jgi:hypothetical protein
MATTSNLSIDLLNSSDYVSVDLINNAIEKLDVLGADYVVASGTSGEWWYRKWKSGRAECGIDSKSFAEVQLTSWGSLYISQAYTFGAFPSELTFDAKPYVGIMYLNSTSGAAGGLIHVRAQKSSEGLTTSPSFSVVDATQATYGTPTFGCYVVGRWK